MINRTTIILNLMTINRTTIILSLMTINHTTIILNLMTIIPTTIARMTINHTTTSHSKTTGLRNDRRTEAAGCEMQYQVQILLPKSAA
ncbi:hypothetical protein PQR34_18605 [Paraburkholderia sediminicola]|uniref:hypothetical protein n=1 Tax=Paraburkholderia sediminicola TaxID=458836 RepID=UPI0038BB1D2B